MSVKMHCSSIYFKTLSFFLSFISLHQLWIPECWSLPAEPHYFDDQLVDHTFPFDEYRGRTWTQRFYVYGHHFAGPGCPIFLVLGGEGAMEPSAGMNYPFVTDHLAVQFEAYVLQPEHRFYGQSQPVSRSEIDTSRKFGKPDPRVKLLTSEQALRDAIRLLRYVRDRLRCSRDRFSELYCPVITVGGSYPGFLSAMARLLFPEVIDMAYAASAPMKFYAQQMYGDEYYTHITNVAETHFSGCSYAVRETLDNVQQWMLDQDLIGSLDTVETASQAIGVCSGTLPQYIQTMRMLWDETLMMAGYSFANHNMAFYPPHKSDRALAQSCKIFNSNTSTTMTSSTDIYLDKLKQFFILSFGVAMSNGENSDDSCFNMNQQVPTGPNATISAGDWSGVGTGASGESWDFQTCTLLVERIAFGNNSMFPFRSWTMDWMQQHCQARFNVKPHPTQLVERWHFDRLLDIGATRILFTNGLLDGWSVSGIQHNLSESLLSINFPNGAHHSDLSFGGSKEEITDDITKGRLQIQTILGVWLQELPGAFSKYGPHRQTQL